MLRYITNLPNLFTSASIFCGFYAIILASDTQAGETENLYKAALAIIFASLFDMLDGRVARMTRSASEFGMQYDSLADVVSFGVAPAFLLYQWGLAYYGGLGLAISFVYLTAGAMRLARFNIITKKMSNRFSLGLTITESGGMVAGMVILHHRSGGDFISNHLSVLITVLVLAYLMVSNIRFRTFKDLRVNQRSMLGVGIGMVVAAWIWLIFADFLYVLVMAMAAHIAAGLLEEVLFYRRRRQEELRELLLEQAGGAPLPVATFEDQEDDEE